MKYVIFLGDGMADEPIESLGGKTPVMAAETPNIDALAASGHARFGNFLSLPDAFPTSSDVANTSVLGYDLAEVYSGRGPLEAASQGIVLQPDEIAMRCNLVTVSDEGILEDYSGGQVKGEEAEALMDALIERFNGGGVRFEKGVSYRNLLILKGGEYSDAVDYEKPDDHPGDAWQPLLPKAREPRGEASAAKMTELIYASREVLEGHPVNAARRARGERPANMIWLWSVGRKSGMQPFRQRYGKSGAIISAVDVIKGLGVLSEMEVIEVEGATGYIDTNYEGKARAAAEALKRHDFVYLHVEGIDEVSHEGNLELKMQAISDFDRRLIGTFYDSVGDPGQVACAVLPDHPVPIALRKHTRTPVPVMFHDPRRPGDPGGLAYNEFDAPKGSLAGLAGDGVMRTLFSDPD